MGNTLTGQIVAETYEALLKVTDNGIITGTKKRITDGFGNDTPLLLSSTDVQIDGNFLLPGTTLQYVRGDGSLATFPTIISTLTTTGSSGASTLIGSTLNIPNYTLTGLGGVPTSRTLTINGTTFDLSANRSWTITDTGLTSVGISMPSAFTVSNSPLTSNGTIAITGAGLASQYIRGDGTLANFPTTGGGGSSVSYYMNGSVNQGTILGNTYYEFNKTPIIGAGTDFTINANGYISQFITDANDPALLEIPGGNWNFEMYFSASSGGGSPSFYVELYKYNGTAFTLIASNSTTPEGITGGTVIDLYTTALAVPQTTLTLTDRLAIRVYVTHSGRTITLHTENSHLCQVITTFSTGINALNSLTKQVQYLTVGTSGTDFAISSATDTHTFNLPTASGTNRGALSSADWTTFNNKQNALTNPVTGTGTTNYVPKFTGSTAIGNSIIFDNGTQVGIYTASPAATLDVNGNINSSSNVRALRFWGGPSSFTSHGAPLHIFSSTIGTSAIARFNNNESTDASTLTSMWLENYVGYRAELAYTTHLNGSNIYINNTYSSGNILFNIAGSEKLRIASSGNVGIGTTSAIDKLTVSGRINVLGTSQNSIWLNQTAGGSSSGYIVGRSFSSDDAQNFFIYDALAAAFRLNINSSGNVGIGTTSPTEKLHVSGGNIIVNSSSAIGWGDRTAQIVGVTGASGFLRFDANNAECMRINSAGNVGIGTSSPTVKLHVYGTGANSQTIRQESSISAANAYLVQQSASKSYITGLSTDFSNSYIIYDATASAMRLAITSAGNVRIGTTANGLDTAKMYVLGDVSQTSLEVGYNGVIGTLIRFSNSQDLGGSITIGGGGATSYNTSSDYRLKEDLKEINGLDKVSKLKVYDFKWKNSEDRMDGVLAHELQEVIPYAVVGEKDGEDMQGVDYSKIVPILVKAIQEQQIQIEELKAKLK